MTTARAAPLTSLPVPPVQALAAGRRCLLLKNPVQRRRTLLRAFVMPARVASSSLAEEERAGSRTYPKPGQQPGWTRAFLKT